MKGSPLYQNKGDVFIVSLSWLRQLQPILALDIFESVSMSCFQQMRHSKPVLTCILDKVTRRECRLPGVPFLGEQRPMRPPYHPFVHAIISP